MAKLTKIISTGVLLSFCVSTLQSQIEVTLEDQCNCEILRGEEVFASGLSEPEGTEPGDLYVNNQSGVVYWWTGTEWREIVAADNSTSAFTYNTSTNDILLTKADGTIFSINLSDLLDNTDAQTLELTNNNLSISGGNQVDLSTLTGFEDNLGNHTATQNIQLNGNYISNDGDNEGITVSELGNVGIGLDNATEALDVEGTARLRDVEEEIDETYPVVVTDADGVLKTIPQEDLKSGLWQIIDIDGVEALVAKEITSAGDTLALTNNGQLVFGDNRPSYEFEGYTQTPKFRVLNKLNYEDTDPTTDLDLYYSAQFKTRVDNAGSATNDVLFGSESLVYTDENIGTDMTTGRLRGSTSQAFHYGSGTLGTGVGLGASVKNMGTGTITNARAYTIFGVSNDFGGTIDNATGLLIPNSIDGTNK